MKTETRWIVKQADRNFMYISCSVDMEFWQNTLLQGIYYFKYADFCKKITCNFFANEQSKGENQRVLTRLYKTDHKKTNTHCHTKNNLL